MIEKYNKYITIAKGIGILLVVLGHCANSNIERFLLLFHMPLFFFLSGYVFKDKYLDGNFFDYIKKKIKSLYLPYLVYELIFLCLHNFFININFYNCSERIYGKDIFYLNTKTFMISCIKIVLCAGREPIGGALWFLVVLFFVSVLYYTISYWLKKKLKNEQFENVRFTIIVLLFLLGNVLTKYGFTIPRFNNTLVMMFIYYLGNICKKNENKIKFNNIYICIVSTIFLFVNYLYGSVSVNTNTYLSPDFVVVNCLLGVYIVLYVSKKIEKIMVGNIMEKIGNCSLGIMALHFLAFKFATILIIIIEGREWKILSSFPTIEPVGWYVILYFVIGTILPIIMLKMFYEIKKIMKKSKITCYFGTLYNKINKKGDTQ